MSEKVEPTEAMLKAVRAFERADTEFRRAKNDDRDSAPARLNRAGTDYAIAKYRLFRAAKLLAAAPSPVPDKGAREIAREWADAFGSAAERLGYSYMDRGFIRAWFTNAIASALSSAEQARGERVAWRAKQTSEQFPWAFTDDPVAVRAWKEVLDTDAEPLYLHPSDPDIRCAAVKAALAEYHRALAAREHGGVAADRLVKAVEQAFALIDQEGR